MKTTIANGSTITKTCFKEVQEEVEEFVEELIMEAGKYDEKIAKLNAKKSLLRIYRDIRFSKDKTPYKTNFGISLGMGKSNEKSGHYLHIEPKNLLSQAEFIYQNHRF